MVVRAESLGLVEADYKLASRVVLTSLDGSDGWDGI